MGTILLIIVVFYYVVGIFLGARNNDKSKPPLSKRTKQLFLIPTFTVVGITIWHLVSVMQVLQAGVWSLDSDVVALGFGLILYVSLISFMIYKKDSMKWIVNLAKR